MKKSGVKPWLLVLANARESHEIMRQDPMEVGDFLLRIQRGNRMVLRIKPWFECLQLK
jgi:hypothetical protein